VAQATARHPDRDPTSPGSSDEAVVRGVETHDPDPAGTSACCADEGKGLIHVLEDQDVVGHGPEFSGRRAVPWDVA
jgi:hypothetical protein